MNIGKLRAAHEDFLAVAEASGFGTFPRTPNSCAACEHVRNSDQEPKPGDNEHGK